MPLAERVRNNVNGNVSVTRSDVAKVMTWGGCEEA